MTNTPAVPLAEPAASREPVVFGSLASYGRNWTVWFGPLVSLALLGVVFAQAGTFDFGALVALIPRSPGFWIAFVITYSVTPLCDWLIFHRLWRIPLSGLGALFHKRLSNELLLGYVGDAYFYVWARGNVRMNGSPFGAVKDSAILSGMVGNFATLAMLAITFPLLASVHLTIDPLTLAGSLAILVLCSVAPMVFRRRLFSLPKAEQRMVATIHLARVVISLLLYALLWHLMLPDVALRWWVILATVRLALSRLPLVPNKDVLFAGAAGLLIGRYGQIAEVLALLASLVLAAHIAVGAVLGASGAWIRRGRADRAG